MSNTTSKRSRSDKGTKGKRSKSSKKDGKSRRKSTTRGSAKKRSRSTASKKDGKKPKVSKTEKTTKKAKLADEGEKAAKAPKISARKIEVKWTPREKWAVRTQPFRRLVNHYAHEIAEKTKMADLRLAANVARAIQAAVEEETVNVLRQACMMALHAKRTTVQKQDVTLTSRLDNPIDIKDAEFAAVLSKRATKKEGGAPRTSSQKRPAKDKVAGDAKSAVAGTGDATTAPADGTAPAQAPAGETKKKAPKRGRQPKNAGPVTGQDAASAAMNNQLPSAQLGTVSA